MNSRDIYRTLRRALSDEMKRRGYERVKGTFPAWTRPIDGGFVTAWFQAARQGAQFTIELQRADSPQPGAARWAERKRLYLLLDEYERGELSRTFRAGGLTANEDYWFAAADEKAVRAVAEWFRIIVDELFERMARQP